MNGHYAKSILVLANRVVRRFRPAGGRALPVDFSCVVRRRADNTTTDFAKADHTAWIARVLAFV